MDQMAVEKMQAYVFSFLYDHPTGADMVSLRDLLANFFTQVEIDQNLHEVLREQHSRSNVYQGDAASWFLTDRCRKQMDEALPKAQIQRLAMRPSSEN